VFRKLHSLFRMFGFDPKQTVNAVRGLPAFFRDYSAFKRQQRNSSCNIPLGKFYPCLEDRYAVSGTAQGHYFHQDLLVARRIHLTKPGVHVDVGSRVDGFVAHVAAFRPIVVVDVRPLPNKIVNVTFMRADLMRPPPELMNYCDSLSCLHALEHFGLGRYGDPIDCDGHIRGLESFHRILKTSGKLYLSVPIGPQRVEFNAQRVFSVPYLLELFGDRFQIEQFSYVDDAGNLHENVAVNAQDAEKNFGCNYGCGIFELTKS
jgi:hypothetical protein